MHYKSARQKHGQINNLRPYPLEVYRTGGSGASGGRGYTTLLNLETSNDLGRLLRYRWGDVLLMPVKAEQPSPDEFALNSRDILLFKKHPEATSTRNMLPCVVRETYQTDWLVRIELDCQGNILMV